MTRAVAMTDLSRNLAFHLLFLGIFTLLLHATAAAHELRPAIVTATIDKTGGIEVRASLNLEAWLAGISSEHQDTTSSDKVPLYDRLRASTPADLRKEADKSRKVLASGLSLTADTALVDLDPRHIEVPPVGDLSLARSSTLELWGKLPAGTKSIIWQADKRFGDTVIRFQRAGEDKPFYSALVTAGATSAKIPIEGVVGQPMLTRTVQYAVIGFEHIIPKGLDHILFIIGLFLLTPHLRPLLLQVTGFTLAHSATLALGIYGLVSVPTNIVEPLIALSIAFIAVENLLTDKLQRWRTAVVFGFGLLHGLGFAGVLSEIGLPQDQFVTALIGFNIGVEIGQLAVLAACFLCVGLWFRQRSWYRPALSMPASVVVGIIAMVWFVERIA